VIGGGSAAPGPKSLTELSLAVNVLTNSGKYDFLVFDSLTSLLIYNNPNIVEKFCLYLANKTRNLNIRAIFLAINEEKSEKLGAVLSQSIDKCITV
jgi:hypothetical protein